MHSLSLIVLALMAIISLPVLTFANTTEGTELEEPKTLPLTDAVKSDDDKQSKKVSEFWTEDVNEVVIRKQRGAKENGAAGKKKERKNGSTTTTKMPHIETDTNLESNQNTTQEPIGKKHQHHQSKHEKTNSKKHTSTIKPKTKNESNYQSRTTLLKSQKISLHVTLTFVFVIHRRRLLPLHEKRVERVRRKNQHPIKNVHFEERRRLVRLNPNHPEEVQEGKERERYERLTSPLNRC